MAWLVGDGFDFYNTAADAAGNPDIWAVATFVILQQGGTRTGLGNWMFLGNNSATNGNLTTVTFANSGTIFVNMNIRSGQAHVNGGTQQCVGFSWQDAGNKNGGVFLRNGGDFVVTTGGIGSTVLATSSNLCPTHNTWYHIQVKIVIHNTAGSVELRLNGSATASFLATGINTRNLTANFFANSVNVNSNSPTAGDGIDDFYVFNDQAPQPNTFQGDVQAIQLMPTTDVATAWVRNGGTNNCLQVDDARQDGDSTYVATNVVNAVDTYALTALATTPEGIVAVCPKYVARMDDVGPHQMTAQLKSGPTTVTLPTYTFAGNTYAYQQATYTVDPNTSATWSAAAVNSLQLSIKDLQ
jgi:hypothetical protein